MWEKAQATHSDTITSQAFSCGLFKQMAKDWLRSWFSLGYGKYRCLHFTDEDTQAEVRQAA